MKFHLFNWTKVNLTLGLFSLAFLVMPGMLLTQHLWHPFGVVKSFEVHREGREVYITAVVNVHRRYPAVWRNRLVHVASGEPFWEYSHEGRTQQVGTFPVKSKTALLPEDALPGVWCYISTAQIRYNQWNTQVEPQVRACFSLLP